MENQTNFANIANNAVVAQNTKSDTAMVLMRVNKSATFVLSLFAVRQLLGGASCFAKSNAKYPHRDETFKLLAKLAEIPTYVSLDPNHNVGQTVGVEVTRTEVEILRSFLEAKMLHCEKERDERKTVNGDQPVFNADTYIGMKLMLLDIREWLLGEAVEISSSERGYAEAHND